jgi:hypothetical protein
MPVTSYEHKPESENNRSIMGIKTPLPLPVNIFLLVQLQFPSEDERIG